MLKFKPPAASGNPRTVTMSSQPSSPRVRYDELELGALRVFAETTRLRSMTGAATALGLTQSAVSQSIRRLEARLEMPLIKRKCRPLALTDAGEELALRAAALIREADAIPFALRAIQNRPARELRLGFVDTFAATAGPTMIQALTNTATRVVLWSGLSPSLGCALINREVDAIVTSDPMEDVGGLQRVLLLREPFVLLLPPSTSNRASAADLRRLAMEMTMVRYSERSYTGLHIERHLRRLGIAAERRIEVDGSDALVAMVAAGIGWALSTPLCILQAAGHLGDCQIAALKTDRFSRSLYLIYHDSQPSEVSEKVANLASDVLVDIHSTRLSMIPSNIRNQITTAAAKPR